MKTASVLILGVLVLSLALGAAPVRAAEADTGYIVLVTQADSKMPFAAQAQMAFDRLAPALLAAEQSGYLADFKPEFQAGIVILRFGSTAGAASLAAGMLGLPVYSGSSAALAVVPHEQLAPAGEVSATTISARFGVNLFSVCFDGTVPANGHVIATLKDNAGHLKAASESNADSAGYFNSCWDWSNYRVVIPGDKVNFKVYDSPGGTLLGTFGATAPSLTFTTLSKPTAHVGGKGPAGKPYTLTWEQPKLNATSDLYSETKSGTISPTGNWGVTFSTSPMRGGATLDIYVKQTTQITFHRAMNAPYIYCQLGGNYCDIYGFGFQALTFKLKHGSTTYTFGGQATADGWLGLTLQTSTGSPLLVRSGDAVQGTNVASYAEPALVINSFDFTNDILSGKVPANKYFDLSIETYSSGPHHYWRHSNSSANWSIDTTAAYDLKPSEVSSAEIYYISPTSGNATDFVRNYAP